MKDITLCFQRDGEIDLVESYEISTDESDPDAIEYLKKYTEETPVYYCEDTVRKLICDAIKADLTPEEQYELGKRHGMTILADQIMKRAYNTDWSKFTSMDETLDDIIEMCNKVK